MLDTRRIFIALPLAAEAADSLSRWIEEFTKSSRLPLRLVDREGLHLTLIPPWYAETKEIDKIRKLIDEAAAEVKPFSITLEQVAYGPDARYPRLIWATGPHSAPAEELRSALQTKLRGSGIDIKDAEKRKLLTHITLARFSPESAAGLIKEPIQNGKIEVSGLISGISLMESVLSPSGARYETIHFAKFEQSA